MTRDWMIACYFASVHMCYMFVTIFEKLLCRIEQEFVMLITVGDSELHRSVDNKQEVLLFCRTTIRQKCICYQGPSVWNSLPLHIKLVDSTAAFKILHQQYLINRY